MQTETKRKKDSEYSKKYDEKRKATRIPLNLYQDNDLEKEILERLLTEKNKKQVILEALKKHYGIND
ncbi:hypothetical protein NI467_06500 [Acinetobacter bohemicus]|nr:hypothetical protein [Acinetobacter sp. S4397-1]MCO8045007.1 hypothetical protein [Acinetobacter sp. S4397-1]